MRKVALLYLPVLHRGYMDFIKGVDDVETLYLLDAPLAIVEIPYLRKEVRALQTNEALELVRSLSLRPLGVKVLSALNFEQEIKIPAHWVMPDDDLSRHLEEKYFHPPHQVTKVSVFLRWDSANSLKKTEPYTDYTISRSTFDREVMGDASEEALKSSDWWRQVGGVLYKAGEYRIVAHNVHMPSEYTPYINGDPRNCFKKGMHFELTTALHAEQDLAGTALRHGLSTLGASIYISTFPCPMCAKLIAHSGISHCFFKDGYAMLDGETILKESGVELIRVIDS